MWNNKRFISVIIITVWTSLMNVEATRAAQSPLEFEGRLEFLKPLAVEITAGTVEHPKLVQIEWIRFDKRYGNAWGVTAHVGWLPVKDATWRLTIELLDEKSHVLQHSRDEPTVFTCKANTSKETEMKYVDLDLDAMHDQGRRHAVRFRVRLEPSKAQEIDADSFHTIDVKLIDQESRKAISDAAVEISSSYRLDSYRRYKTLFSSDTQGQCQIRLNRNGLASVRVRAQKQDYCSIQKSWSNYGSWSAPIVNLPPLHEFEMIRATALGGIVQDTEGNTIGDVEVKIEARREGPDGMVYTNRSALTNKNGNWRVDGMPDQANRVTLKLRHTEYGGDNGRDRRLTREGIANARALKHVESLEKGLTLTGKVLDEKEQPIAKATVLLAIQSYSPLYTLTDASGTFRLACSSDRSVYRDPPSLIIEAPGYAPVQQIIDLDLKPLTFRLIRGRSIICRVVDTQGQPVVGAWTVVEPLPDNRRYSVWLKNTDDQGEFLIPNVPQSDVKLTVGNQGFIAIRDHIVAASKDEVVVTMQRALRVHGTVTDTKTGKAIPHFEMAAVTEYNGRIRTGRPVAYANGTYEASFDETRPELRQLKVTAVGYEPATSKQIKTEEGEREINFKLIRSASFSEATAGRWRDPVSPTGMRPIKGMVRDELGQPVPDAIVITYPMRGKETVTDAQGAFTLRVDGRMRSVREEEITYLLVRQKERNLAAAVELDPSADKIDVKLIPGVILSGKVVNAEAKGIPSAELSLTFWTSNMGYGVREDAKVDEEGHYEIRAVPSGHRYSVNAKAEGYGERYVRVETGDAVSNRMDVEPLVLSVANLSVSGIVVDDFDQPVSSIRIYAYGNGQPSRETFTDTKGRFTIENICPGPLSIQANSRDRTTRRLHGRTRVEGGATDIKIIVYEMDQRGRRVQTQPPSLAGKPLPDLKDVGLKLTSSDIEGKSILVCFWDMSQRPSRHCMTQLAKQIEPLKAKGVVLVAIQALKMDTKDFDEWIRKNNIPFSAMIKGDAKKTRLTWGIRSLPWLILTDIDHLIRAEGFSVNELDAKLQKIK